MTTSEARKTNFRLIVALDDQGKASGTLYLDDGESTDEDWANHSKIEYEVTGNKLTSTPVKTAYVPEDDLAVDEIVIMGLSGPVTDISITGSNGGPCFWNHDEVYAVISCETGFVITAEWSLQVNIF